MKYLILLMLASPAMACDDLYVKIGAGYKFHETEYIEHKETKKRTTIGTDPVSARIELGIERGNITYGVSHHSQWRIGFPFNDRGEMYKTELFVDYKFSL